MNGVISDHTAHIYLAQDPSVTTSSGAFCGDYTTYSTSVLSTPRGGEGAGYIAENDINNKLTKHIDIRYHFTRQHIREKTIELFYVPSADNVADICTKALGPEVFIGLANKVLRINPNK